MSTGRWCVWLTHVNSNNDALLAALREHYGPMPIRCFGKGAFTACEALAKLNLIKGQRPEHSYAIAPEGEKPC